MSEYNSKNYTEQGGEVTHIAGKLIFENGSSLKGGLMPNQEGETPSSDTVAKVRTSLNSLLTKLKNAGLMKGDAFDMTVSIRVSDSDPANIDRAYNSTKMTDVVLENHVITITMSEMVRNLRDFDAGEGKGVHKWIGIAVHPGVYSIADLFFNGVQLTDADEQEAVELGLDEDSFVLWMKADEIVKGVSNVFTLWADGYEETEYKIVIIEPDDSGD